MNRNRVPWMISTLALLVALIACLVALSPRVTAQDDPAGSQPVAVPVVGVPVTESAATDSTAIDPAAVAVELTAAFTYQGVLHSGNAPANGSYDFQFKLFTSRTGAGTQRGPTLVADDVPVVDGRFSTLLDFGNVFSKDALWVDVQVRDGASTGAFTALTPRQSMTAVPVASYATTSGDSAALQTQINTLKTQVTTLNTEVAALNTQLGALQALLSGVSSEDGGATLRITGRNLQVVSGSGTTNGVVNGRGNIIVGYNEANGADPTKTGSHMLIVGIGHVYNSYGGVVFGAYNRSLAPYATVLGGTGNYSDGTMTAVVGGVSNHAQGGSTVIVGGNANVTSNDKSVVVGGQSNYATGLESVVAGGRGNVADGSQAIVAGGYSNGAHGQYSVISGGEGNAVSGQSSTVGGGVLNTPLNMNGKWGGGDYVLLDP